MSITVAVRTRTMSGSLRRSATLVAAASAVGGLCLCGGAPAGAANAACPDAASSTDTSCTFDYTGGVQSFKVPPGVVTLTVTVNGAAGGSFYGYGQLYGTGGAGGGTSATVPAHAGDVLSLVVGGKGGDANFPPLNAPGLGGYGGGGDGGARFSAGAGGGGGSFLFAADGTLELAAGGGGGAATAPLSGFSAPGGIGAGAGQDATDGGDGSDGATGGQAASATSNGAGGDGAGPNTDGGAPGTGSVAGPDQLPTGGRGGDGGHSGGGGGGGYFAAGGGGGNSALEGQRSGAGGGGSGYAEAAATDVSGNAGTNSGNGSITISYAITQHRATVVSVTPAAGPTSGGQTVTITGDHFGGASKVVFGRTPASSYTVDSDSQITAVTPVHAIGVVQVRVQTLGLSAKNSGARYRYTP